MAQEKRCLAIFQPQAWIRDNAVDIDGKFTFDVTDQVLALGREAALAIPDAGEEAEALWASTGYEALVEGHPHYGPYTIWCERPIADFFDAQP
jgi:hypothetical protein